MEINNDLLKGIILYLIFLFHAIYVFVKMKPIPKRKAWGLIDRDAEDLEFVKVMYVTLIVIAIPLVFILIYGSIILGDYIGNLK